MSRSLIFLTHAEVQMDPAIPVPDWSLSDLGRDRHTRFARNAALAGVTAIYSSTERKAAQAALPVAKHLGLSVTQLQALGENDRSATGYLPAEEFERTADRFFDEPDTSVRGWERARAAQARIVAAVQTLAELDGTGGDLLILAHGAVGALLRCHLGGIEITRKEDQPAGGGCYFITDIGLSRPPTAWRRI